MTTRTSNDGPRDVSETLSPTGSSGRDPSQTSQMRQASNASTMMISDTFMDLFMLPKITEIVVVVKGLSPLSGLCAHQLEHGQRSGLRDSRDYNSFNRTRSTLVYRDQLGFEIIFQ